MSSKDIEILISVDILNMSKNDFIKNLQILIQKATLEKSSGYVFKIRNYNDAIKIIQKYPHDKLSDVNDIEQFFKENGKKNPKSTIEKVSEFIELGYISAAKEAMQIPQIKSLIELTKIAGIGPVKAEQLYDNYKIVTIKDLQSAVANDKSILHGKQLIGLKYYFDLEKRIPRSEITEYDKILQQVCKCISPNMKLSINGSYRRKVPTSGDIDVLVTGPKGKNKEYRKKLIEELTHLGIIKDVLASGEKKFMGVTLLPGYKVYRHMDIIDTDIDHYPFAQLYFTGSGAFNADMRAYALTQGYSMNEYCLSDKKTKITISSEIIREKIGKDKFTDEKDIFQFLGMDYILPEKRNSTTLSKIK